MRRQSKYKKKIFIVASSKWNAVSSSVTASASASTSTELTDLLAKLQSFAPMFVVLIYARLTTLCNNRTTAGRQETIKIQMAIWWGLLKSNIDANAARAVTIISGVLKGTYRWEINPKNFKDIWLLLQIIVYMYLYK